MGKTPGKLGNPQMAKAITLDAIFSEGQKMLGWGGEPVEGGDQEKHSKQG